jgi:O-acetyl-ADP-ribose deacetylase (regulator of RNase III)
MKDSNSNTNMPIWIEEEGDLIKYAKLGHYDVIAHGCNCKKNFGAGIALTIKQSYPLAYQTDLDTPSPMGGVSICSDYEEVDIVNAYTQFYPGKGGFGKDTQFHRYNAIRESMKLINQHYPNKHIGLPLIGCGLAGLKWSKVKKILKEELKDLKQITIVRYKKI